MWAAQSLAPAAGQRFITSGGLGAMGFALPAAIGAALAAGAPVVAIAGDGGFQLNLQELQTLVETGAAVKIVILDNGVHGMVRQFQESYFDGRFPSSDWGYSAPDFARVARAYGIEATTVAEPARSAPALADTFRDVRRRTPARRQGRRHRQRVPEARVRPADHGDGAARDAHRHGGHVATEAAGGSGRNLSQKVAVNTALLIAGRVAVTASGLVGTIFATRYLGVDRFGQLLTAVTFVALFGVLTDAGVWTIAAREIAKRPQDEDRILTTVSLIGLVLSVATFVLVLLAMLVLYGGEDRSSVRLGILVIGGQLLVAGPLGTSTAYMTARQLALPGALGGLLAGVGFLVALAVVIAADLGFAGVAAAYTVSAVLNATVPIVAVGRTTSLRPRWDRVLASELLRAALPAGLRARDHDDLHPRGHDPALAAGDEPRRRLLRALLPRARVPPARPDLRDDHRVPGACPGRARTPSACGCSCRACSPRSCSRRSPWCASSRASRPRSCGSPAGRATTTRRPSCGCSSSRSRSPSRRPCSSTASSRRTSRGSSRERWAPRCS